VLVNSYIHAISGPVSDQMLFGYIDGSFTEKGTTFPGVYPVFFNDIDLTKEEGGFTVFGSPVNVGYDYTWQYPSGITIDRVEVTGSNDEGFCVSNNPTDLKITLEAWDGSWNNIGDTGEFTDGTTAVTKTINSTDTSTLFTRFRVVLSYSGGSIAAVASLKLFEFGGVQVVFPTVDESTPVRSNSGNGKGEQLVDDLGPSVSFDCAVSIASDASDYVMILNFDKSQPIDKAIIIASSTTGFINAASPTDVQLDMEGWDGSSWIALGDTGTFTDASSLSKTINSSDTTTHFSRMRITLSTATSAFRLVCEIKPFVFPVTEIEQLLVVGYIEGTYTHKTSGSIGMAVSFDGDLTKVWNASALTVNDTNDGVIGYDFTSEFPLGMKIDKVEVWGASDHGYCVSFNPTDTKISLEGWNGSSWVALGDTGDFTDTTTANMKSITSSDSTTLFFKFRLLVSTTQSCTKSIAAIKLYEVTAGLASLNFVDVPNITPSPSSLGSHGRPENVADGVLHPASTDALVTSTTDTSDFVLPIVFGKLERIWRIVVHGITTSGFIVSADPTDVQIDIEGWNGSSWVNIGDTGIFTDAPSLEKEIISTDQTTAFSKVRALISTASSVSKVYAEIEIFVAS